MEVLSKVLTEIARRTACRKPLVESIWSMMSMKKCYSIQDLVNITGATYQSVSAVMYFLSKYGFVQKIGVEESVYSKSDSRLSPDKSVSLLKVMIAA
jgi:hypothetical protein